MLRYAGADAATIWAVLPPGKDPAALLRYAPLQRLQREIWLATARAPPGDVIRLRQLSTIFDRYNDARARQADARRRRQDPLSAAIYAATVVGWRFQNLTTVATEHGALCLHTTSEAELRRLYLAAWRRRQERLADAAWERRGGLPPGHHRTPDVGASATQRRTDPNLPGNPPPGPTQGGAAGIPADTGGTPAPLRDAGAAGQASLHPPWLRAGLLTGLTPTVHTQHLPPACMQKIPHDLLPNRCRPEDGAAADAEPCPPDPTPVPAPAAAVAPEAAAPAPPGEQLVPAPPETSEAVHPDEAVGPSPRTPAPGGRGHAHL